MIKKLGKSKKKIGSLLLMISMIVTCFTYVSLGNNVHAATGLTITYSGSGADSNKLSAARDGAYGTLNPTILGPVRNWKATVTGNAGTYTGTLVVGLYTTDAKLRNLQFTQSSSVLGITLGNTSYHNSGTKVYSQAIISIVNKTANELQDYLNNVLTAQLEIDSGDYSIYKGALDVMFEDISQVDGVSPNFENKTVATGILSASQNSDTVFTISGTKGQAINTEAYIRLTHATFKNGYSANTTLTGVTNIPGVTIATAETTLAGASVMKIKFSGIPTATFNSTFSMYFPYSVIAATADGVLPSPSNNRFVIDTKGASITIADVDPNIALATQWINANLSLNGSVITEANDSTYQAILNSEIKYPINNTELRKEIDKQLGEKKSGLTYQTLLNSAKAFDLNSKRNEAKKQIDDKVTEKNNYIDSLNLSDSKKNKLKDAIKNVATESKTNIDKSTSFDDIINGFNTSVDDILTPAVNMSKAIDTIENYAKNQKENINKLNNLTNDEKKTYLNKIDGDLANAKTAIENGSDINKTVSNFQSLADKAYSDAKLLSDKKNAKDEIVESTEIIKNNINNVCTNLTTDEKNKLLEELVAAENTAKQEIDNASTSDDVNSQKQKGLNALSAIDEKAKLANAKNLAISQIDNDVKEKLAKIDQMDNLSEKDKTDYKNEVTNAATKAKTAINEANTPVGVTTEKVEKYDTPAKAAVDNAQSLSDAKKSALAEIATDKTAKINAINAMPNLSDNDKAKYAKQIEDIATEATDTINAATTTTEVTAAKTEKYDAPSNGIKIAAELDNAQKGAKKAIESDRDSRIAKINAMNDLSDADKAEYVNQMTTAANNALSAITTVTTVDAVNNAKAAYDANAPKIETEASNLNTAKEDAKINIEKTFNSAKQIIESLKPNLEDNKINQYIVNLGREKEKVLNSLTKNENADTITDVTAKVNDYSLAIQKEVQKANVESELQKEINRLNTNEAGLTQQQIDKLIADVQNDASKCMKNIDGANLIVDVNNLTNNFKNVAIAHSNYKSDIYKDMNEKIAETNALEGLTDKDKAATESYYNSYVEDDVFKAIDQATTVEDLTQAKSDYKLNAEIQLGKDRLLSSVNTRKETIKTMNLSDDEKDTVTNYLNELYDNGIEELTKVTNVTDAGVCVNNTILKMNDAMDGAIAVEFTNDYLKSELDAELYDEVNSQNIDQILNGKDTWAVLTPKQQEYVNTMIYNETENYNNYQGYLDAISECIESSKETFIKNYVSDDEDTIYQTTDGNNFKQILSGKEDWDNLSKAEQNAINQALTDNEGQTYEELIAYAQDLDTKANSFIKDYVSDEEGTIYQETDGNNFKQILAGLGDWDKLSDDEKDAINYTLLENEGKTYGELVAYAQELDAKASGFIENYVSDKDNIIYKEADGNNFKQILSGLDAWNKMSQDEKDAVNAILTANDGKTYEELIAYAQILDDAATGFIDKYLTGKDGNIYKAVDSSNYGQILSGLDAWNKMSQDEKDAVNAILTANGGKTYEELIANAKALKDSTDSFVNKYLTGKDGKIYKEANKSNYAQILSGKDAWNKLSQSEKDAINAILKANGGKTYEELLKQANDVKASVKTSDNTDIMALCTLLSSSLLLGGYVVFKRREEA